MARKLAGKITHYFPKVGVAVLALNSELSVGDLIEIEKEGSVVKQEVKSMQIDHKAIQKAKKGTEIGLKVYNDVKPGSLVYIV